MQGPPIELDEELLDDIASALDLREPNRNAVATLAERLSVFQQTDVESPEFVFVAATGVGKTYAMAGMIDYLAEFGVRHMLIAVNRTTLANKTVNNFTPGHPKAVSGMAAPIRLITIDDLDSSRTATEMEDDSTVKVYVMTVQSILKPTTNAGRRTHDLRESLGDRFYDYLREQDDLVVFADEHHAYYGDAFSDAIRDLSPMCLVGLTATPHKKTPEDQIVFQYPLANAIADKHVKRPVIVGRSDDLKDDLTKLHDGVTLLEAKQRATDAYADATGQPNRNMLMLVSTQSIEEAKEVEETVTAGDFFDGRYADAVLRVDSSQPEEALQALEDVEDSDSPHRIIVAVDMLKEGWDVATVAVICSLRASVSEILTEQTLGRGLRLPWGEWVTSDLLNELDVLAHERYEDVLKKARTLNQQYIDHRTLLAKQEKAKAAAMKRAIDDDAKAKIAATFEQGVATPKPPATATTVPEADTEQPEAQDGEPPADQAGDEPAEFDLIGQHAVEVTDFDQRRRQADTDSSPLAPRTRLFGTIAVPTVETTAVTSTYSLPDLVPVLKEDFAALGRKFANDPEDALRRYKIVAKPRTGKDGLPAPPRIETVKASEIKSSATAPPLNQTRDRLIDVLFSSTVSEQRPEDENAVRQLVNTALKAAGDKAKSLGLYTDLIAGQMLQLLNSAVQSAQFQTQRVTNIETHDCNWTRRRETDPDLLVPRDHEPFDPHLTYTGWAAGLYEQARFDSGTERDAALLFDDDNQIHMWVRLHINDIPVDWTGAGKHRTYNPDFIVVEDMTSTETGLVRRCWLVETKSDREFEVDEVKAKHEATEQWVSNVNAAPSMQDSPDVWGVLRVSESHVKQAKGRFDTLKALGQDFTYDT